MILNATDARVCDSVTELNLTSCPTHSHSPEDTCRVGLIQTQVPVEHHRKYPSEVRPSMEKVR